MDTKVEKCKEKGPEARGEEYKAKLDSSWSSSTLTTKSVPLEAQPPIYLSGVSAGGGDTGVLSHSGTQIITR